MPLSRGGLPTNDRKVLAGTPMSHETWQLKGDFQLYRAARTTEAMGDCRA